MNRSMVRRFSLVCVAFVLPGLSAHSQNEQKPYVTLAPQPRNWPTKDGTVMLRDFKFRSGETLPELKLHYLTLGAPHRNAAGHVDNAILLLHGTGGNAHSLLNSIFSNVLFVPGGILDIQKYFIILPDDIG